MSMHRLATAAIGLGLAAVGFTLAPAAEAAAPAVPADCGVSTRAYRSDGHGTDYAYVADRGTQTTLAGDILGWQPKAYVNTGGAGGTNTFESDNLAVHPTNGNVYNIHQTGTDTKVTSQKVTLVTSGWSDTRALAFDDYLYRLTANGLYRYPLTYAHGFEEPYGGVTVARTGWSTVSTLVYERTEGKGAAAVDVLLGTQTSGALKEWRINRATPTRFSAVTLKASGWQSFTSISTGYCDDHPNGRPILAITGTGQAYAYFDKDATDGSGADFSGVHVPVSGWTAKGYGE